MSLYSANVAEEEEDYCEGRLLSSTQNGVVSPSQRGPSSLYPTSPSVQIPVHTDHVASTGTAMHFSYTSDPTECKSQLYSPEFKRVCFLLLL